MIKINQLLPNSLDSIEIADIYKVKKGTFYFQIKIKIFANLVDISTRY